jgi:hypothetical protein
MPSRVRQGQGISTIDKERRIAAALTVSMRIANAKFGSKGYRFWYMDANCGSGYNHQVNVPGSPLVFWNIKQECLTAMDPVAHFCDRDTVAIDQLRNRFAQHPETAGSTLLNCDNEDALYVFAENIMRSENQKYAVGAALFDPNGYFWRSATGVGVPTRALEWFPREFPRIDIILNLNMRTFHLQRGAGHAVMAPVAVLGSLNRAHWLVARAGGQNRHLLAVGRNMPVRDHKALGFYHHLSKEGLRILNVDAWKESEDPDLFGAVAA